MADHGFELRREACAMQHRALTKHRLQAVSPSAGHDRMASCPAAARKQRLYTWQVCEARRSHLCALLCPGTRAPRWPHALKRTARGSSMSDDILYRLPARVKAAVLTCMSIIAVCTEYVPARQHEWSCPINWQQDVLPRSADSKESVSCYHTLGVHKQAAGTSEDDVC